MCHNLELSDKSSVMVTLQHSGSNAGFLDWVKLHSWDVNKEWTCYIGVRSVLFFNRISGPNGSLILAEGGGERGIF